MNPIRTLAPELARKGAEAKSDPGLASAPNIHAALDAAVTAYDEARIQHTIQGTGPMSEANRRYIRPMIEAAIIAYNNSLIKGD